MTTHPSARARGKGSPNLAAVVFEAAKFLTLRFTTVLTFLGIGCVVVLSWLLGASAQASGDKGIDSWMPAPQLAFATLQLAQLFLAMAAAVSLCTEYATGTIAASLQAVPVRGRLLAAKAVVLATTGLLAGTAAIGLGTLAAAWGAGEYGAYTAGEFLAAASGAGIYLALMMLMVLGLAALCRNTAGSITAALVLLIGLPQVVPLLRAEWIIALADYLPTQACAVLGTGGGYGPGVAAMVLLGWATVLLGGGYLALRQRDA